LLNRRRGFLRETHHGGHEHRQHGQSGQWQDDCGGAFEIIHVENLREREYSIAVSHWTEMVRSGQKGMQFLTEGRYVANVVDGEMTLYGGRSEAIR
jgi:hypothetical protein